ncbi:MAG: hypothetical protein U0V74_09800 [Chitinophagales bacterium]
MKGLSICLLLISLGCYAQDDVFRVHKTISVSPDIDTLLAGKRYVFTVSGINMAAVAHIDFSEGKVQKTDTGFILTVNTSVSSKRKYAVHIYVSGGTELKEVAQKEFTVWPMDLPQSTLPSLQNVLTPPAVYWYNSSDKFSNQLPVTDTISIEKAHGKRNNIFVISPANVNYTVISFRLLVYCKGETKEFFARGNVFTPEMEAYMDGITPGCKITFAEVKYIRNNGTADESVAGPFKMLVQ